MSGEPDIVSLRITLRYKDLEELVQKYAENVSSAGLFLRTKAPKPTGTKIRFELLLADGTRALRGEGVVVTVREDDKPGMALRFNVLDAESQAVVDKIVEANGQGPLAPTPLSTRFGKSTVPEAPPRARSSVPSWKATKPAWGEAKPSSSPANPANPSSLPRKVVRSFSDPRSPSTTPAASPMPPATAETTGEIRTGALPRKRSSISRPWASSSSTSETTDRIRIRGIEAKPSRPLDEDDNSHTVRVDVTAYQDRKSPSRADTVIDMPREELLPRGEIISRDEGPATTETANPYATFDQLANNFQREKEASDEATAAAGEIERRRLEAARRIAEEQELEAARRQQQDRRLEEARRENEERRLDAARRAEEEQRAEKERTAAEAERLEGERRLEDARRENEERRVEAARRAEDEERLNAAHRAEEEAHRIDEERELLEANARIEADRQRARDDEDRALRDERAREEEQRREDDRLAAERREEEERRVLDERHREEDRLAAERRDEEDRLAVERRADEDRVALELRDAEDRLAAERRDEEDRRDAEERRVEEDRLAAARRDEEDRLAAEERRLEDERLAASRRDEEEQRETEQRAEDDRREAAQRLRDEEDAHRLELDRQRAEDEEIEAARRRADEAHAEAERHRAEEVEHDRLLAEQRAEDERRAREQAEKDAYEYQRAQEQAEYERREYLRAQALAEQEREDQRARERADQERATREVERLAEERREAARRRDQEDREAEASFFGAREPRGVEPRHDTILDTHEDATRVDVAQDVLGSDTQRIASRPETSGDIEAIDVPDEELDAAPISEREKSNVTAMAIDPSDAVVGDERALEQAPGFRSSWAEEIGPPSNLPTDASRLKLNDTFDDDDPTHSEPPDERPHVTGPIPRVALDEPPTEHAGDPLLEARDANHEGATEIVRAMESVDRVRPSSGLRDPTDISVKGVDSEKPERSSSEIDAKPSSRPPPRVGPYRPVIERDHAEISIPDPAEPSRPPQARAPSRVPPPPPAITEPPVPPQLPQLQRSDFSEEVTQVPPERLNEPVPSTTRLARDEQSAKEQTTADLPNAQVVGIDFGGRWVRVGKLNKQNELELLTPGGSPYIPALVAVRSDGTLAVGAKARTIFLDDPTRAVAPRTVLRAMKGGGIDSASRLTNVSVENGKVFIDLGVRSVDLHEILVAFFTSIKSSITAHFGHDNIRALISIPNDLDPEARTLLKDATKEAKLPNVKLYSEVEAVIRAYNLEAQPIETMLMVDVGATHVGIAVARRGRDGFAVVGSRWIDELSASELDSRVVDLTLNELNQQAKEDHRSDLGVRIRLLEAVEKARIDIRRNATIELKASLPAPGGASNVGVERSIKLSRGRIYQVTEESVRQICLKIQELLRDVGVHPRALGAIVLAGSAGLYPPLVQAISSLTTKEPLTSIPSAHVFALGLARGGVALEKPEAAVSRPDALSSSIGIQLPGGRFMPLLKAGEQLPAKLRRRHSTTRDNQTEIELEIYQGEGELVRTCSHLGSITLHQVPKQPRGAVNVELGIEVDMDEVVTVTLSEASSGSRAQVVLAGKKTPAQRRAVVAAQQHAQEGKKEAPKRGGLLSRLLGRS
jgi:uncharacterized protein (TIGR02266 family)